MTALHDLEPVPPAPEEYAEASARFGDLQPSDVRLLGMTLARLPTRIAGGLREGAGTAREIVQTVRRLLRDELPPPQLNGPKSRFDQPAGHNRVFEGRLFTLDEFKALKNAAGVTLNDIAVALVGVCHSD